ncbi:DNA repair and recombination protein RAD54B [Tetrabaena socialis]|uniref:DNA repair and recombination protein RAD54B n=1 Tax=Tetrabaena socialis TaxID=47790 RepID=A0A2J7ZTI9_9CHLO|nr:DNA repair and recombination protein RAD54B [Tetrabaena socialis]|eukprot:PNH03572.1 DNA repair and recombination protein RAD54B [Tetrabaena socialis]
MKRQPFIAPPKRPVLSGAPPKAAPFKVQRLDGAVPGPSQAPADGAAASSDAAMSEVFTVLYTKKELLAKKKASKKFADGVITLFGDGTAILYNADSKQVSKGRYKRFGSAANGDQVFELGTWHAEMDRQLTVPDFKTGACFTAGGAPAPAAETGASAAQHKPAAQPFKRHVPAGGAAAAAGAPDSQGGRGGASTGGPAGAGLHDATQPGAVVLNVAQWSGGRGRLPGGKPALPVVVDPYLARHLRPHQEEGVRFMYEAVMGLRTPDKTGCILADEMGLGKTLQVITLAWTLLRQGPEGRPLAAKVLVVTPATLVDNWGREVKKWLGSERLQALCLQQSPAAAQHILEFRHGCHQRLMVISYETLRKHTKELHGVFDLLVCDEGHRLKSVGGSKTIDALLSLGCKRRILLTGTPVQNDLQEFNALLSFVVPDALGTAAVFNRVYGIPITRSQEGTATPAEKELGAARAEELQLKVSAFILRRTQALLAKHLPPLTSVVLFCKPSELQLGLYGAVLRSKAVTSLLGGSGGDDNTLPVITALRKARAGEPSRDCRRVVKESARATASCYLPKFSPEFAAAGSYEAAGKMAVLAVLLRTISGRGERCVVVSTSTATLDLVGSLLCAPLGLSTVRIDGGTSVDVRQTVVDNFNKMGMGQVFLLSTRAGGAGLNLVGANHLVLYDSDWNPAMDQQAMARIWRLVRTVVVACNSCKALACDADDAMLHARCDDTGIDDGQSRPCTVYRTLTTGTIEEKVYQRQLMKADLASATGAGGGGGGGSGKGGKFTREELRQLFSLNTATASDTRDLLPPGKLAGLVWVEPGAVPADGSPLAAAAACRTVSCIARLTAAQGAEGGGGSSTAGASAAGGAADEARQAGAAGGVGAGQQDDHTCLDIEDERW